MKSSRVMAALITLGLAAAAATPAMALENQFSGSFASYYDISNFTAAGNFGDGTTQTNFTGLAKNAKTENYFVQRARIGYTAKVSDDVKLVSRFELDYSYWGNSSYTVGRNSGGALGADSVNIETKNLYIDVNVAKALNAKIGMQGYNDSFKGIIFDADMAGILLAHDCGNAAVTAGFFRFGDRNTTTIGRNTHDMFALDGKYSISKETKVGAAYYYIGDNRTNPSTPPAPPVPNNDTKVHTLGLNGETAVGPLTLTGFALTQFGDLTKTQKAKGHAFNVGAKMPLVGGTVRSELLYAGGGKNALYIPSSAGGSEGGGFYDAEMIMLNRDKNAKTIDTAIVYNANNFDQGLIMGSVGYDYTFTPKLSGSVNAGFAAAAKGNGPNKSDYLGTEINCETDYKLTSNVTFGARAGYVFLGDYFKNSPTLDNPYDVKLIAKLSF